MKTLVTVIVGLLLFCNSNGEAYYPPLRFDHIGIEQGLSDSYIEDALQDSDGYLWIATAHGLNRFDGRTSKVYSSIDDNLLSLDHVNGLLIDRTNTLWICSRLNGLLTYDFAKEAFTRHQFSDTSKTDLSFKHSVRQLCESYDGSIWAVTIYGVARYSPNNQQWTWFTQTLDSVSLLRSYMFCITETPDSVLLVGNLRSGNLFYYDYEGQGFRVFGGKSHQQTTRTKTISCILSDSYGTIWYGSMDAGLVNYNPATDRWQQFRSHPSADSLQSNEIASIFEDSDKILWVGTINGGLSRYNRSRNSFKTYKNDRSDGNSLSSNSISRIFEDNDKNLCFATHNGLNVLNKRKNFFVFYGKTEAGNEMYSHAQTTSFHETSNGILWIGTDGSGLQQFDPATGKFSVYTTQDGLTSNAILDIEPNGDGKLWLATWGGGVMLFDPQTKKVQSFTPDNSGINSFNIKGLYRDGDYIWIGTHGQGVNIYDRRLNKIYNKAHPSSLFPFDMGKPIWINDIYKDTKGDFWIYTAVGLYRFDGVHIHEYIASQNDSTALSGLRIKHVMEDSLGNIWIGANGLDRYNRHANSFERMNTFNKDLPSVVNAIAQSAVGILWLSSNSGLYRYDYDTNTVVRYTEEDGIQGNRFCERAIMRCSSGRLYVGGLNGFNSFDPENINALIKMPSVHITSCKILGSNWGKTGVVLDQLEYIHQPQIIIPYQQSHVITFEFVAPTLLSDQQIDYVVKLEGFEQMPRQLGSHTSVTYTNLAPGSYRLHVWARNARGTEQSLPSILEFEIQRPWYMSILFRIVLVASISALIALFFYMRTRWMVQHNKELSKMVGQSTAQLKEQNHLIQSKNKELNDIIHTRDKLLAIVSHDMKNPLNVLCGFSAILETQYERLPEKKQKQLISKMYHSSQSLQKQVLDLLDWAVMQTGALEYKPQDCNMRIVVLDAISLLQPVADKKNITIHFSEKLANNARCDTRMLSTVIRNLLGNSIKFTQPGGIISIDIETDEHASKLRIHDNGIGIAPEKLATLFTDMDFEVSYGTNNEKGMGLGLKICKEFIDKNRGTIEVSSILGQGSMFEIHLPLGSALANLPESECITQPIITETQTGGTKQLMLIVEDNNEIQALLQQCFEGHYCLELAHNGREGLAMASRLVPDIILSDIEMPHMSGIDMCRKIKSSPVTAHIPIVIVSGNTAISQQIQGLRLGADLYITKPFNIDLLRVKVEQLLINRNRAAQHQFSELESTKPLDASLSGSDRFLQEVIAIIDLNMARPELSVEFLASKMHVSRQQITRKLKAVIGQAPVDFIRSYRLNKAAKMLQAGSCRIADVAYAVGFNDPKYFASCFTKKFGLPPSQFFKNFDATSS
jgi:signal transduction histidine kinase/DNA-binding response OmpR family regulator/streptogramin lyase